MGSHGPEGNGQSDFANKNTVWPKPVYFHARSSEIGRLAKYVESLYQPESNITIRTPKDPIPEVRNPYYYGDTTVVNKGRDRYVLWCTPAMAKWGMVLF
jgi:hypothetical protein